MDFLILTLAILLMKCWRIPGWWTHHENNKSRDISTLSYHLQPNDMDGLAFGWMRAQPDGWEIYGLFGGFKILASKSQPIEARRGGWLYRNGTILTIDIMVGMLGAPREKVARALAFLSTPPMDWMSEEELPPMMLGLSPTPAGHSKGTSPTPAGHSKGTKLAVTEGMTEGRGGGGGGIEIPDDQMVFARAEAFPGEPASGAPKMPRAWVEQWVARINGRERWPADWERKLVADWRVDFRTWGKSKKNAPSTRGPRERWQIEKDLEAVRTQLREHPKVGWPANKPLPQKIAAEFDALVAQRGELEKELHGPEVKRQNYSKFKA